MSEKDPTQSFERGADRSPEQQRTDHERREQLRDDLERRAERSRDNRELEESVERRTAERLAESAERPAKAAPETAERREKQRTTPSTKRERAEAYDTIMADARSNMSAPQRTFSKLIHNRAVESTSAVVGATVARPNAIVAGSFTAFIVVLGVFLVARHYGYPLSGSESIVAFAGGWVLGIVFDYLRALITGRR